MGGIGRISSRTEGWKTPALQAGIKELMMNIWTDIAAKISCNSIESIAMGICNSNAETIRRVRGKGRSQDLVNHRYHIAKQARREGFTLQEIGEYLNRDHSTIIHYLNNYQPQK